MRTTSVCRERTALRRQIRAFAASEEAHGLMRMLFVGLITAVLVVPALAEDEAVFRIEFKDGVIKPARLEVPANRRLKIELHNLGDSPAEFESLELHKEKVLPPNSSSSLVIRTLEPGEYKFFDDFHPDAAPAILVAK